MAEIINIKNEAGEVQYPVTKPECVIDENGKSVLTLIQENGTELRQEIDELSERIDNLPKGDEFDAEGNYPLLHVGTADDLAGRGESVPASFGFRASGGKSIKDGRAYIKRIKGNSVVWNQLTRTENFAALEADITNDGQKFTIVPTGASPGIRDYVAPPIPIVGHKYILLCTKSGGTRAIYINWGGHNGSLPTSMFTATDSANRTLSIFSYNETETFTLTIPKLIDLTKMFGAGNEPTTIEEFNARKPIVADEYAYNEGQVIHCNTESIKSVGDNAWDEQWESGRYAPSTGLPNTDEGIRSKNSIKVLPNENYWCSAQNDIFAHFYDAEGNLITNVYSGQYNYLPIKNKQFTTPANAATMTFYVVGTTTYNHDILISLYHSGWKAQKDDQYQPYWQDTLPLPIISKYFPQGMKSAGTAHDEIRYNKASGKWEKVVRVAEVDMGSLQWSLFQTYGFYATAPNNMVVGNLNYLTNLSYSKYADPDRITWSDGDKAITNGLSTIGTSWVRNICVKDSAYTDTATFKAAMAGVMLYYELAEPIVTELDAEDQNFRDYYNVADFGTEQSQSAVPSAPFSADIIYQFNAVDMIREHELEITELQKVIATMQAQLTSLINGGQ